MKRKIWLRHQSTRQQLRNLRAKCRIIIDSRDPEIVAVGRRVIQLMVDEPIPEFGALHLTAAALDIANEEGVAWLEVMREIVAGYEARAQVEADGSCSK